MYGDHLFAFVDRMAELDHAESTVKLYLSCALLAPRRPSCARDLRRERREETTASSERAKKPSRAIRTNTTATSDTCCVRPCPAVRSSWLLKALEDSMPDAQGSGNDCFQNFPGAMPARFAHAPISGTNKIRTAQLEMEVADSLAR